MFGFMVSSGSDLGQIGPSREFPRLAENSGRETGGDVNCGTDSEVGGRTCSKDVGDDDGGIARNSGSVGGRGRTDGLF